LGISLGVLAILWLALYLRYHVGLLIPVIGELEGFAAFLTKLANLNESNEARISEYIKQTKEDSFLRSVWQDYTENRSVDQDLDHYFNSAALADVPAKRSRASSIPSLLITVGLISSFFCLVVQISAFKEEFTPGVLYSAISQIAVIAIFAVLISYIFSFLNKTLFDKSDDLVNEINRQLKRKLPSSHKDNYLERMAGSIDNMTSSLSSYAQYTADMQRSGMNQLVDIFLESLHSRMNEQLHALGESFENLTSIQTQSAAQAVALADELARGNEYQRQINTASESIISSIAQYHEQITDSSRLLSESLKDLQKLSEALSGIVSLNSAAMQALEKEREALKDDYYGYIRGIYDLFEQYHNRTADELERTLTKFTEAAEKAYSQMESTVVKSMEEWTGNSKAVMQGMEESNRSLQYVSRELAQHINDLNASLRTNVLEFTEAVEKGTVHTISQFDEGLSEITMRLSRTISEIRDAIDDLPIVIDSLRRNME